MCFLHTITTNYRVVCTHIEDEYMIVINCQQLTLVVISSLTHNHIYMQLRSIELHYCCRVSNFLIETFGIFFLLSYIRQSYQYCNIICSRSTDKWDLLYYQEYIIESILLHYGPVLQHITGVITFVMIFTCMLEASVLAVCGHVAKPHVLQSTNAG